VLKGTGGALLRGEESWSEECAASYDSPTVIDYGPEKRADIEERVKKCSLK